MIKTIELKIGIIDLTACNDQSSVATTTCFVGASVAWRKWFDSIIYTYHHEARVDKRRYISTFVCDCGRSVYGVQFCCFVCDYSVNLYL